MFNENPKEMEKAIEKVVTDTINSVSAQSSNVNKAVECLDLAVRTFPNDAELKALNAGKGAELRKLASSLKGFKPIQVESSTEE